MVSNGSLGDYPEVHIDVHEHSAEKVLSVSTSRKKLLSDEEKPKTPIIPTRLSLPIRTFSPKLASLSPSAKFKQIAEQKDEISRTIPSSTTSQGLKEHLNGALVQKIECSSLWNMIKEWIKNPLNMVLFLWVVSVATSGAILFMVMTGMLNRLLTKPQKDAWFEVNNQILNALFTLMCLYQHPARLHHLVLLCRWSPKDITFLRKVYCKDGSYKPNEWTHMMVVVLLLHVNCFAQYALCSLNLGFSRSNRPVIGVAICLPIAIAAPAIAFVYSVVSPLGKEYDVELEAADCRRKSREKRFSFASRNEGNNVVYTPTWRGGLLDIRDDIGVAFLSLFCSFCVFGWNMERLGFGNMYVHTATFILLCSAPFWVFSLAAINIEDETIREALGATGIVLCVFGLLYGGFWRMQMRKRYNLAGNDSCCGNPGIVDCVQWVFCCWCSLAQEVRTGDFYDVVEDRFCFKKRDDDDVMKPPAHTLMNREGEIDPKT